MQKEQLMLDIEKAIIELNFTSAETLAADALRNFPDETFGYKFLAEALSKRENPPYEALEMCYIKLMQLNAHDTDAMIKYAELKLSQGEQDEAIKAYIEVLAHDITNVKALRALGEYELYSNNFPQQALVYFDAAIANAPLDNDLRCHRAMALKESGNLINALLDLNSVLKNGYHELAYSSKVLLLNEMQKFEDTIPLLIELTKNNPNNFTYFYNLGKNAAQVQDYSLSTDAYGKAINLIENPDADLLASYAEVLIKNNRIEQAIEIIQKAIELDADVISYHLIKVSALRYSRKNELALKEVDQLLKNTSETFKNDILIEKALILATMGQLKEAESSLLDIRKQSGGAVPASYALGYLAYHFEKNLDKAFFYLHAAAVANKPEAKSFIKKHLSEYLLAKRAELLNANKSEIAENSANPVLKKLFEKIWQFEDFKSEKLPNPDDEVKSKIKEQLIKRSLFITEDAFLTNTSVELQICTYKIRKQHNDSVIDLELIPLNGLTRIVVRLQISDKGLVYSKDAGEFILYKDRDASNINPLLKDSLYENYTEESLDFIGEKANAFIQLALS